jgi:hypothetical protein
MLTSDSLLFDYSWEDDSKLISDYVHELPSLLLTQSILLRECCNNSLWLITFIYN